eukprot:GFYU01014232.1.p1 GENE.GFYU01014232.1~~GFYU01014232.1.p1  ORF type:complete len:179 (+),score=0.07 GFYU01014232.1:73-609(+)
MFACVVHGRPLLTNFQQMDQGRWVTQVTDIWSIHEVAFFLTGEQPLPEGFGVSLYLSFAPYTQWDFVGACSNLAPSAIVPLHKPALTDASAPAQLGVSLESAAEIMQKLPTMKTMQSDFQQFAKSIAKDLFRFLESFSKADQSTEYLAIPTNALDHWITRFGQKCDRDAYFWRKLSED